MVSREYASFQSYELTTEQAGRKFVMMKRREFITLLGAATAWPLAARAQRTGKMSRIGYLGVSSPSLEPHYIEAFRQKLHDLGHIDGENIAIEYRWAEGQDDRLPNLATELVHLKPDVIVTSGTPGPLRPCKRPEPSPSSWRHPPIP